MRAPECGRSYYVLTAAFANYQVKWDEFYPIGVENLQYFDIFRNFAHSRLASASQKTDY